MFEILDALLATAAVILGLGLIVQAMQQIFKQAFDLKNGYMRKELTALFVNDWNKATSQKAITSLKDASCEQIQKLIGLLEERMKGIGFKDLELLENIDSRKLKEIFKTLDLKNALNAAEGSLQSISKEIDEEIDGWFDLAKQAFQNHYERRMKAWALGISAAVVIAMNVNLFDTYALFSSNKAMREIGVAMGQRLGGMSMDSLQKIVTMNIDKTKNDTLLIATLPDKVLVVENIIEDRSFQFFGWRGAALQRIRSRTVCENIVLIPLGWLGMALLVSLGAPFWYDILKSLMGFKNILKSKSSNISTGN